MFKINQEIIYRPLVRRQGLPQEEMRGFVQNIANNGRIYILITSGSKRGRKIQVAEAALIPVPLKHQYL